MDIFSSLFFFSEISPKYEIKNKNLENTDFVGFQLPEMRDKNKENLSDS
jgi:hypothetical protein